MKRFQFCLVPCTCVPHFRKMHRQTKFLWAVDEEEARIVLATAFPGGVDLSGEWFIEAGSLKNAVVV